MDFERNSFILWKIFFSYDFLMFSLQIIEKPSFQIEQSILDSILESIHKHIKIPQKWCLNIVFLDELGIQNLNKNYRNIDKPTDVLSFHYFDDFSSLQTEDIAWELIFCESKVVSQGTEYGLGTHKEFYKLLIHSILHILGFDHEEDEEYLEMKHWEEIIWEEVFS